MLMMANAELEESKEEVVQNFVGLSSRPRSAAIVKRNGS